MEGEFSKTDGLNACLDIVPTDNEIVFTTVSLVAWLLGSSFSSLGLNNYFFFTGRTSMWFFHGIF